MQVPLGHPVGTEAQETSASSLATAIALNSKLFFFSGLGVCLPSAAMELWLANLLSASEVKFQTLTNSWKEAENDDQ